MTEKYDRVRKLETVGGCGLGQAKWNTEMETDPQLRFTEKFGGFFNTASHKGHLFLMRPDGR